MSRVRRSLASASERETFKAVAGDARALRLWRRRVEGALGFLEELAASKSRLNKDWRDKMKAHYVNVVTRELEIVPLGGDGSAKSFRARLRALTGDGRS